MITDTDIHCVVGPMLGNDFHGILTMTLMETTVTFISQVGKQRMKWLA